MRRCLMATTVWLWGLIGCNGASNPGASATPCKNAPFADDVCVTGGEFSMGHAPLPATSGHCSGSNDGGGNNCGPGNQPPTNFAPMHQVRVRPFFIDRYPVTNAQYLTCLSAGLCPDDCGAQRTCQFQYSVRDPQLADYPMATAMYEGAVAYCRWAGKRLPTEAEWERAARGPQSFDYPWGNAAPDCSKYPCGSPPFGWKYTYFAKVAPGGADVSPDGIHGMVTSAPEFVSDLYDYYYYERSPVDNPQGPANTTFPLHVARGNLNLGWSGGPLVYDGTSYPLPAWARDEPGGVGGIRCARDDSGAGPSEALVRSRQHILSGAPAAKGGKP